jgi:beta-galactosidase
VYDTPFGIRTFIYDPDQGLFINGLHVEVKGTCNHQDFAGIGIGMPDNILSWRISKLISMGSNGYRTSHNPPAAELLDACDRQGMLVLDENRHLGDTYDAKSPAGTVFTDPTDLDAMVLRDRNHPSVFMWSLCNEEGVIMGTPLYGQLQTAMQEHINAEDPTRPCTAAEWGWEGATEVDGLNYSIGDYDSDHINNPNLPMIATEDSSSVSTRGIYAVSAAHCYDEAYDNNLGGSWTSTEENAWSAIATRPFMEGGFNWTGFDYHGEPTPYGWPATNSGFGIMDLCGFPKDNYYYQQSVWLPPTKPVLHILPHWTWPGMQGTAIPVWAYTNGDYVELFLNGVSQGMQAVPPLGHVSWSVNYAPGTLIAVAYKNGVRWASQIVQTAGAPATMAMRSDIYQLRANGEDISPVELSILDANGVLCPTADNDILFTVTGPGRIVGVGNGNPSCLEPDYANQREAFNGKCMVLVRHTAGYGTIVVTAKAAGLPLATFNIAVPNPATTP